ncbi:peptidase [Streptacidiphilus pinicola]|uniref:Peptidase n=1 Tax=Streptacidiphilus pinicola TaxID=2219663 RepID=A0A2X0JIT4_9ACTN|nr:peptidase [Streptacidiphilus pinicola]
MPAGAAGRDGGPGLGQPNAAALQTAISGLPNAVITGSLVDVGGTDGTWRGVSGLGDVAAGTAPRADARFRIGSVTKVFTAIVTLQLVAEHRITLDQSIQHYLPGVLPADFPPITVAQLLDHTSGLPGVDVGDDENDPAGFVAHRFEHPTPAQIEAALGGQRMSFPPGTEQQYNGVNYFLLGTLIEHVTGHSYASEVDRRVIRPLRLSDTEVPAATDYRIPGPKLHGYLAVETDGSTRLVDVTRQSPYPWAEGGMISSARDLGTVMQDLLAGRLLPSAELNDMFTVPDVPYLGLNQCQLGNPGRACFGMGLMSTTIDGVTVWGKTGSRPGYTDGVFATRDGGRVLVYAFTPTSESANTGPFILGIARAALS